MNTSIGLDFPEFCDDEPPASIITKPTRLVVKPAAPINRVELLGQHLQEAFLQSRPAVIPYQKPAVHIARPLLSPQNSKVNVRTVNVNPVASTSRLSMGTVETKPEAPRNKVVAYLPNTPHLQNNQMDRTVYVSNSDDSADYHHNLNPWIPNYKCRKPDEVGVLKCLYFNSKTY